MVCARLGVSAAILQVLSPTRRHLVQPQLVALRVRATKLQTVLPILVEALPNLREAISTLSVDAVRRGSPSLVKHQQRNLIECHKIRPFWEFSPTPQTE